MSDQATNIRENDKTSSGAARLDGLDWLRVFAAFAVILLHAAGATWLMDVTTFTRFAVPFFAATAAYLAFMSGRRDSARPIGVYCAQRFTRLYIPMICWTAIYMALRLFPALMLGNPPVEYGLQIVWTGSVHHLWFLPFVIAVTCSSYAISRTTSGTTNLTIVATLMVLLAGLCFCVREDFADSLGYTARLSFQALPAALVAVGLAIANASFAVFERNRRAKCVVAWLILAFTLIALTYGGRDRLLENLSGVAALVVGLTWQPPIRSDWISSLSQLAFGIYLAHIMFVEGIEDLLRAGGIAYEAAFPLLTFLVSSICTAMLCVWLSQFTWASHLGIAHIHRRVAATRHRAIANSVAELPQQD